MKTLNLIAALTLVAAPAFAEGDAAKGETDFKRCKACHSIVAPDGTAVQKGGKTGPNLYGVIGRTVASFPDFKYGDSITGRRCQGPDLGRGDDRRLCHRPDRLAEGTDRR